MKKTFVALMCIAGATLLASCGETKEKTAEEGFAEAVEEIVEDAKSGFTDEAYACYAKKLAGVDVAKLVPEIDGFIEAKQCYGEPRNAFGFYYFENEVSEEDAKAYVAKVYEMTKAAADGNINVWGFESKDTKEEAEAEITLDDVYSNAFFQSYSWGFIKDGTFKRVNIDCKSKNDENFIEFQVYEALQKSFSDSMKQVEEALEDEEVQKAIKEKLGQ